MEIILPVVIFVVIFAAFASLFVIIGRVGYKQDKAEKAAAVLTVADTEENARILLSRLQSMSTKAWAGSTTAIYVAKSQFADIYQTCIEPSRNISEETKKAISLEMVKRGIPCKASYTVHPRG